MSSPFPMAPVGAQGVMALSEEQDEEKAGAEPAVGTGALGPWRGRRPEE